MKSNESDNAKSNPGSETLIPGKPDAGKSCTSGLEGGVGKRADKVTRPAPTLRVRVRASLQHRVVSQSELQIFKQ
jgi:hypothetical protein